METDTVISKIADHANVATYGGGAASVAFWGLHVNEVCAIVSTVVAVLGFGLQCLMAWRRRTRI